MRRVEVSELSGSALDWAVAKAIGLPLVGAKLNTFDENHLALPGRYSIDWSQGGPLIEREDYALPYKELPNRKHLGKYQAHTPGELPHNGPTPLIAACRAIVASKIGDTVEVPEELL